MTKLPILSGKRVIRLLSKIGFTFHHQKGSHIVLKLDKHPYTRIVVPDHKELKTGLLLAIMKQAGLTREEFIELLQE